MVMIRGLQTEGVPFCSSLSILEVMYGVRRKEERVTRELLHALRVVPVRLEEAEKAAFLMRQYRERGINLDLVDAVIAASCLLHELTLVTYNKGHYPMPALKVFTR